MKDKKIAVYYIATGDYKKLFPEFLDSVKNLYPNCLKVVKLISDGLQEYENYSEENVKVDLCPRINDYPWPIVALYKMWHIYQNKDDDCDYVCYFNANSIINKHDEKVFDLNKITVSYHSFNSKAKPYDPWQYINLSGQSSAYLPNESYEYVQSGFFFGKADLVYQMCFDIVELVRKDTRKHIFAQWHDESYLNKWCVLNEEKVDRKYIMTIYKNDVDETRFIFLRNKNNYDIDKNKLMNQ